MKMEEITIKQRTVRKSQNSISWETTVRILEQQLDGVLGVVSLDGYPYCVPMNYVFAENKIIMHSAREGYKLNCLAKNPQVSFTAYNVLEVKPTTSNWECAMIFGRAQVVSDVVLKNKYMRMLAGKFGDIQPEPFPPELLKLFEVILIDIEEFSGKIKA